MTTRVIDGDDVETTSISPALTFLLATACGLIAANLYYGQPLAGIIGAELGLSAGATGLIVGLFIACGATPGRPDPPDVRARPVIVVRLVGAV